jgi:hypothetical protein
VLITKETRVIAEKVVNLSKATAKRDTGFLKRSISYTVEKNVFIFVEVFYGQFGTNSKLEQNARRLMPSGVKWRMRYTDINGKVVENERVQTGRNSINKIVDTIGRQSTTAVTALINKIKGFGKKKDTETNRR